MPVFNKKEEKTRPKKKRLFFYFIFLIGAALCKMPENKRSSNFNDVQRGKKLQETLIDTKVVQKRRQCSLFCNSVPECRSFNFCYEKICELNNKDRHSDDVQQNFVDNSNCDYYGMLPAYLPDCKDDETDKEGFCYPKFGYHWSDYWNASEVVEDTDEQWIKLERKECLRKDGLVVNDTRCSAEEEHVRKAEWIKWQRTPMLWKQANAHCIEMGGHMWAPNDLTVDQLSFAVGKLNNQKMIIGVNDKVETGKWVNTRGVDLTQRLEPLWAPGDPMNRNGEDYVLVVTTLQLYDVWDNFEYVFACDML